MNSPDQKCVDTIRFLAVDAVQKANSGHPGMPLGAAPMAFVLWDRFLKHNPDNPDWFNRDRFVLSAGHGSMLVYSLLHLYGYDLPLEEIEDFRQWGSRTAGHPEYRHTPGVECTTGPLGQGFAMGVGMALAEAHLSAQFQGDATAPLVDHTTYAIASDGDLMEGVACEAASLAGTMGLGKLVYLYDDNRITIEGSTDLAFTEDAGARFEACGWQVLKVADGNDLDAIEAAIHQAKAETHKPSLICVRTHIGFGSPRQDSEKSHGEPLGADNVRATKEKLGWPLEPAFHVPEEVRAHCRRAVERGVELETQWRQRLDAYRKAQPEKAALFKRLIDGEFPDAWADALPQFDPADKPMATRSASGKVLNGLAANLPNLMGGSADLGGSNKSEIDGGGSFGTGGPTGRNIHFGVREHAMGAIVNGMALHGGMIPYGATFLIFADYMRPSLRLAALMNIRSLFIFSHDSIGLGEDGPTHQPVEHLMALRAIPNFTVFRPADANETLQAWKLAVQRSGPSAFALSRQNLAILPQIDNVTAGVARGGYVLADADGPPDVILVATGSEVHLALAAQTELAASGVNARVVSMPSWELWKEQDDAYRAGVLPADVPKLAVEAGITTGWRDVLGAEADVIGIDRFGASAPGDVLMEKFGFTTDNVIARALALTGAASAKRPAAGR